MEWWHGSLSIPLTSWLRFINQIYHLYFWAGLNNGEHWGKRLVRNLFIFRMKLLRWKMKSPPLNNFYFHIGLFDFTSAIWRDTTCTLCRFFENAIWDGNNLKRFSVTVVTFFHLHMVSFYWFLTARLWSCLAGDHEQLHWWNIRMTCLLPLWDTYVFLGSSIEPATFWLPHNVLLVTPLKRNYKRTF